ncbi:MAG: hypothetical protein EP330_16710 [Deltaproteobacteria bacterium]|nr:MAG: hypothetical protein EP330_16710 [Deltaproteobacteria bacterium]
MRTLSLLLLVACTGGHGQAARYELRAVEGLPAASSHQFAAFEQPDHLIIGTMPFEDGGLYTLEPGSVSAEHALTPSDPILQLYTGVEVAEHAANPLYLLPGAEPRLVEYTGGQLVDAAPRPPFKGTGQFQGFARLADGTLLYLDGSMQLYDPDSDGWTTVLPADTLFPRRMRWWEDQLLVLNDTSLGALTAEGYTELATCPDTCDWQDLLLPNNGEVWIRENWRYWSWDGDSLTSLGDFPNPGAELGEARFISQVMSAGVLDERIFSLNRESYTDTYGWMLSWAPGQDEHLDHEVGAVGPFVGSDDNGMVIVPWTQYDPVLAWAK